MRTLFGSPKKVIFCKECVMSNQKPDTTLEYQHEFSRKGSTYLKIGNDGICQACKYCKSKYKTVHWKKREEGNTNNTFMRNFLYINTGFRIFFSNKDNLVK